MVPQGTARQKGRPRQGRPGALPSWTATAPPSPKPLRKRNRPSRRSQKPPKNPLRPAAPARKRAGTPGSQTRPAAEAKPETGNGHRAPTPPPAAEQPEPKESGAPENSSPPARQPAGWPASWASICVRSPAAARSGRVTRKTSRPSSASWPAGRPRPAAAVLWRRRRCPTSRSGARSSASRCEAVRRRTAEQMSLAWSLIPHVTQHDLADVTDLEAFRKRAGRQGAEADRDGLRTQGRRRRPASSSRSSIPASTAPTAS